MKYLVFTIDSCRLALEVNKVREIIIPGLNAGTTPEKILSEKKMVFQDRKIPVIILADFLFDIPSNRPERFRIVVCEINDKAIGLLVDSADEIIRLSKENIISTDKSSQKLRTDFLDGKFVDDNREIFIVAPDKILNVIEAV